MELRQLRHSWRWSRKQHHPRRQARTHRAVGPVELAPDPRTRTRYACQGIPRRVVCEVGDWELFLELVSAGVGIGFAPVGLQYPVLTAPDSVLRLIAVEGVRLERHIYLILPSAGETSPAARRFADQLLRIHPAGS